MQKLIPILLAGGSGTRLWPLSRSSYPKQFSNLLGDKSLFQEAALRLTTSAHIDFSPHITLTNSDFRFIVSEQLQEVGIDPGQIIIEPETKNTAPAILAASLVAYEEDEDAVLLVSPSDHIIPDMLAFHEAIKIAQPKVFEGKIVTFGVSPTRPETGYGYLEVEHQNSSKFEVSRVISFIEKPEFSEARRMITSDRFLWNSGIFMFKASVIIEAFKLFAPNLLESTKCSVESAEIDLGFLRLSAKYWRQLEDISIDYAIMEQAENLVAVNLRSQWSDLGDWSAVWTQMEKDKLGSAVSEGAHSFDCVNTLLRSENSTQQIVGLGLKDIIAVSMPDAVLIAKKDRSQDVKHVVKVLESKNIPEATVFPKEHRPWGSFESLVVGDRFQVKRIQVKPEGSLSLQSHTQRSEHWVVVEGTAKVTIGEKVEFLTEGQSVYVPLGVVHRLENPGNFPMVLIEVQIGCYFGEDDIVRYDDIYNR